MIRRLWVVAWALSLFSMLVVAGAQAQTAPGDIAQTRCAAAGSFSFGCACHRATGKTACRFAQHG